MKAPKVRGAKVTEMVIECQVLRGAMSGQSGLICLDFSVSILINRLKVSKIQENKRAGNLANLIVSNILF